MSEYTEEEWVVAEALGSYSTLDPEILLPETREAIKALDEYRASHE